MNIFNFKQHDILQTNLAMIYICAIHKANTYKSNNESYSVYYSFYNNAYFTSEYYAPIKRDVAILNKDGFGKYTVLKSNVKTEEEFIKYCEDYKQNMIFT